MACKKHTGAAQGTFMGIWGKKTASQQPSASQAQRWGAPQRLGPSRMRRVPAAWYGLDKSHGQEVEKKGRPI